MHESIRTRNSKRPKTYFLHQNTNKNIINIEKSSHINLTHSSNSLKLEKSIEQIAPDKKSANSQIYEYEGDELNELPFDKAIKYDKRNFCQFYGNIFLY